MNRKLKWIAALLAIAPAASVLADEKPYTQEIPGTTVKFEMVPIPGGTLKGFKLNKNSDAEDVQIKPFLMEQHEVTWDEYGIYCYARDIADPKEGLKLIETKVRPSKPYESPTFNFGDNGYPCLASTEHAAQKYCEWLSQKTGRKYRLPTAAEWQWAAQGGAESFTEDQIKEMSWNRDNSSNDEFPDGKSHPVMKLKPNGYGLYDMFGNVCEWVIIPGADPNDKPVAAGGSWRSSVSHISPSYRQTQTSSWNQRDPQDPKSHWWLSDGKFVGFRVVCDGQ